MLVQCMFYCSCLLNLCYMYLGIREKLLNCRQIKIECAIFLLSFMWRINLVSIVCQVHYYDDDVLTLNKLKYAA